MLRKIGHPHKETCTVVFIVTLFLIAKKLEITICPGTGE